MSATTEHAEAVIRGKARRDWVQILLILVIVTLLAWITVDKMRSSQRADVAVANASSLAEQIQRACLDDDVIVSDQNICDRAADVAADPAQPVVGAPGTPGSDGATGAPGPRGETGATGAPGEVGPQGPTGATGDDGASGAPGTSGADGATGATGPEGPQGPVGATGPAGADGQAGAPGADGVAGTDGRGVASVECQTDGTWLITYTDTTTSTTPGPCRVLTTDPLPEETP